MIRENVFDAFTITFEDGRETALLAKDVTQAYALAQNIFPVKEIINVKKISGYSYDD
jgi:hypothetical protein